MIPTWGSTSGGATLALNFVNSSSLPSSVTFSRGTQATQYGSSGALQYAPNNLIRNNMMVGAAAGTPGTLPTNWFVFTSATGLTTSVVGTGTDNGISYIDVRFSGTASGGTNIIWGFDSNTAIAASNGQTWTESAYLKLQAGTTTGITDVRLQNDERTATTYVRTNTSSPLAISSAALNTQRYSFSTTLSGGATVTNIVAYVQITFSVGVALDITLRIGMPQLEQGSTATAVNATSGTAYYGPRFDYDPTSYVYQNLLTYSEQFDNAAWSNTGSSLTISADAINSPIGTLTADLLTPTVALVQHRIDQTPVSSAGPQTFSVYAKSNGYQYISLRIGGVGCCFDIVSGTFGLLTATSGAIQNIGGGWYQCSVYVAAALANDICRVNVENTNLIANSFAGNGTSGVYIWGAQLNIGSTALPYYATTSAAYTQCAPRGLLIEEARTNSIRNNTMQGAVAGTPGTLPTNWNASGTSGLTQQIVGTGIESGISYIDVRLSGTTSSALFYGLRSETATSIAASPNSVWAVSTYLRVVGGSTANLTAIKLVVDNHNSAGTSLLQYLTVTTSPTSAPLISQRFSGASLSTTFTDATTAYVQPYVQVEAGTGVAIDITLRIGLPQLELGAFATSVIPTFGTAATRNADIASIGTLTPWYNASAGTLYAEYSRSAAVNFQAIAYLGTAAQTDYMALIFGSGAPSNNQRFDVGVGGVSQASIAVLTAPAINTIAKTAGAYALNDFAATANGATPTLDTAGTIPTVNLMGLGTGSALTGPYLNGWLRKISYYPSRLPDATLKALTA